MKKILFACLLSFPSAFASDHGDSTVHPASSASKNEGTHWSYGGEGGPMNWAKLDPRFSACAEGREQSPIDLRWNKQKGKRDLSFHYSEGPLHVVDNGHTIQVNVPLGSYALIDGEKYSLLQFHFHAESEHTFSGEHYPLELHFVHKSAEGKLAVVGVMFEVGAKNSGLETVFLHMPGKANEEKLVAQKLNPASLLPSIHTHYQYQGSLTTPPCSEGVSWTVLNTPIPVSEEQLSQFRQAYVHNNRPLQNPHGRKPASF